MSSESKSDSENSSPQEVSEAKPHVFTEVDSSGAKTVEVLSMDDEKLQEISQTSPNTRNSWLPWKRPNRRDQQLRHLREGYIELLGLVRSISTHLDSKQEENSQVSTLVESLPPALNSFEKLATSQKEVTAILGNLNTHMEKTSRKDDDLLENMQGFNSALKEVSSSNEKSLGTLNKVSERIENSDEQMKMLFENATENSRTASALMVRLEKRVFLSNLALVVLLCLLLVVAMFWVAKDSTPAPLAPPTVITLPAALANTTPLAEREVPATEDVLANRYQAPESNPEPITRRTPVSPLAEPEEKESSATEIEPEENPLQEPLQQPFEENLEESILEGDTEEPSEEESILEDLNLFDY